MEYVAEINSIAHIVVLTASYSFDLILFLLFLVTVLTRPKDFKMYVKLFSLPPLSPHSLGWEMFSTAEYNSWRFLHKTRTSKMSTGFRLCLVTWRLIFFLSVLMIYVPRLLATAVAGDSLSDLFLAEMASWVDVCSCDSKGPLSNSPPFPSARYQAR